MRLNYYKLEQNVKLFNSAFSACMIFSLWVHLLGIDLITFDLGAAASIWFEIWRVVDPAQTNFDFTRQNFKKFRFFQANFRKILIFLEISQKKIIFLGTFSKNFDFS